MYTRLHVKNPLFLSHFLKKKLEFSRQILDTYPNTKFH